MPLALILSSFVAASRIGGAAQQYLLAAHRIDPVLVPTVMLGRKMPGVKWFDGGTLNYAEHAFRHETPAECSVKISVAPAALCSLASSWLPRMKMRRSISSDSDQRTTARP